MGRAHADDIYREDITFRDPRNAFRGKRCGHLAAVLCVAQRHEYSQRRWVLLSSERVR